MGNKYASYLSPNIHTTGANIFGCGAYKDRDGSDSGIACYAIRHHTTLANQWCWCWIAIILTMDFLRGRTWPLWTRSLLVVKILLGSVQGAGCPAVEFEDKKQKQLCTLFFFLQNWCQKWSQRLVFHWWWSSWWSERSDWWWVWWWELRSPTLNRSVWLCKSEISHLMKIMCQDFQYGEISHQHNQDNVSRFSMWWDLSSR